LNVPQALSEHHFVGEQRRVIRSIAAGSTVNASNAAAT
jgi:hypothetical protein